MSRYAALKNSVWLCCGLSDVEQPRVRLLRVWEVFSLCVSSSGALDPHRVSDQRKDMGGRSQAYRCTHRKWNVVLHVWSQTVLRSVMSAVYLISTFLDMGFICAIVFVKCPHLPPCWLHFVLS